MDMEDRGNSPLKNESREDADRKQRVGRITRNFFLHIHATRVHMHSMKPTYTFGLGIILGFLFLIMVFTGVILMIYYTPSVESAYQSVKDIVYIGSWWTYYQEYAPLGLSGYGYRCFPAPVEGILYRLLPWKQVT